MTVNLNTNDTVQDLSYYYDTVGNITTITDGAQQDIFYDNCQVSPDLGYTYDALYRLVRAEGREHIGTATFGNADNWNDGDWRGVPFRGDGTAVQAYIQKYSYDAAGNITQLKHIANSGAYTRDYTYGNAGSNDNSRLYTTQVGSTTPYGHSHDARGNLNAMPHLSEMDYDALNQMSHVLAGTKDAYYQYSGGQRIRKHLPLNSTGRLEQRIYLGNWEVYRKWDGSTIDLERTTVHVSDGQGRIAMLEVRTVGDGGQDNNTEQSLKRFIYSNHLGSSALELDEQARIISYEEYHPYGTTAYQAMNGDIKATAKRYRFTGKERDEESGLNYHGARYYAPWLARWCAVDPLESKYAGLSPYNYCLNNPGNMNDPDGMSARGPKNNPTNTTGVWESHDPGGYSGQAAAPTSLDEVVVSGSKNCSTVDNTANSSVRIPELNLPLQNVPMQGNELSGSPTAFYMRTPMGWTNPDISGPYDPKMMQQYGLHTAQDAAAIDSSINTEMRRVIRNYSDSVAYVQSAKSNQQMAMRQNPVYGALEFGAAMHPLNAGLHAIHDFSQGNYGWGTVNAAAAAVPFLRVSGGGSGLKIALGLFDGGNLVNFTDRVGGINYLQFGQSEADFYRVVSNTNNEIHFNLEVVTRVDGASSINLQHALLQGLTRSRNNITNWELREIAANKEWLSRTTFYSGGKPIQTPSILLKFKKP